jgi:hypothetical protein
MKKIAEIRARRELLIAEASRQRHGLAVQYSAFEGPASVFDVGLNVLGWLRQHPLAVGAIAAALFALRLRRALRLAGHGMFIWRSLRTIQGFLREARVSS